MPSNNFYGLKYEISFAGESWLDVTSHVDSRQTKVSLLGCSADLMGGISTLSVELRYGATKGSKAAHSDLIGSLLFAKQENQAVLFKMSGIFDFVGKVDLGNFSQANWTIPGFASITVEDNSYLLDEKMETFEYPPNDDLDDIGWSVFDPVNHNISIVTQRLLAAGYSLDDIDLSACDTLSERVRRVVSGDDDKTYRQFLNTILFEHCAILHCRGDGKFVIKRLYQEAPVASREITEFLVNDKIQTKGGDYQNDAEMIVWSTLNTIRNPVYVANISLEYDKTGPIKGEEVLPKHYWPKDGDIEETWQEFDASFLDRPYLTEQSRKKNKDLSIVSVKNVEVERHFDVPSDFLLANNPPEIEPRRARFLYYNKNEEETRNIFGFSIIGDVLYRAKLNESEYPPENKNPAEKYETEFIFDALSAERLVNHLYRFRKHGDLSHKWSEISDSSHDLFEVVQVSPPDTHISTLAMVLSQDITFPAPKKIKTSFLSVGITSFSSHRIRTRSLALGALSLPTARDGESGEKVKVQYALGDEDAPYEADGVLLGTDDDLVGTEEVLIGYGEFDVWKDSPPIPEIGEYVWRREGYYTPPATWPNFWNITRLTGTQGEDAEKIELFKNPENIVISARGWNKQRYITITARLYNITGAIAWTCSDGTIVPSGDNEVTLDGATVVGNTAVVTASVTTDTTTHTFSVSIDKITTGDTDPFNFGAYGSEDSPLNPVELPNGDILIDGDYFLWVHDTVNKSVEGQSPNPNERLKGQIYVYRNGAWGQAIPEEDGDLVMTLFDSFAKLENDVEKTVIGSAVIKKLVAIEAFIDNLKANNIVAGQGKGTAGTGFRFRAMTDKDMDGSKTPVFDVMYNDAVLFKVDPVSGNMVLGNWGEGAGLLYDAISEALDVRGSLFVGDGQTDTFKASSKDIAGGLGKGDVEIGDYASGKGVFYDAGTGELKGRFSEIRNVMPFNFIDSLDSAHPFEIDFYIPTETVNIVSVKLNARGISYRAYSMASGYIQNYSPWGDTTGTGYANIELGYALLPSTGSAGDHSHAYDKPSSLSGGGHSHALEVPFSDNAQTGSSSTSGDWHTHGYKVPTATSSSFGTDGEHSHSITSSSSNTGSGGSHSHSLPNIVDSATDKGHTHSFSVDIDHTHDITMGIIEGTSPKDVKLYCDNGSGYGSAITLNSSPSLATELDLTSHFSGTGWKRLKFTSSQLGRVVASLIVKVDITT